MKNILVIGGAGYIGSHQVKELLLQNYNPITFDNLSEGHRKAVIGGEFIKGDIANLEEIRNVFKTHKIDAVMHFGANCYVGESVIDPQKYYRNNVCNTINLLSVMLEFGVKNFVYSSSAAIYGEPKSIPISETHIANPINPYGQTKWMVEMILRSYERAYGMHAICFRYFNAAGADPEGQIGEDHNPETHLIPLVLKSAIMEVPIKIYGDDYKTKDGTCVRDYIHVKDLAKAHIMGLLFLEEKNQSEVFNLGTSSGYSVLEIIKAGEDIIDKPIEILKTNRREGDPEILVADFKKAKSILGWEPKLGIEEIILHSWQWIKNHPQGYNENKQSNFS